LAPTTLESFSVSTFEVAEVEETEEVEVPMMDVND
jgi:hypothetical protein